MKSYSKIFILALFQLVFVTFSFGQLSVAVSADPAQVCSSQPTQLTAVVSGGSGTYTYSWVGTPGNFVSSQQNPIDAPTQTTVYTLTVSDGFQISTAQVTVEVIPYPTGNAGEDQTICESAFSILLSGTASDYSSVTWQCTNGNGGYFLSNNTLNATYMLSDEEKEGGYLQFKLYTYAQPPCNIQIYDVDEVNYTIAQFPTIQAGDNAEVCEGETYLLNTATAQDYSSLQWTSSGAGYFTNDQIVNPTYIPSEADYDLPSVTLSLTATAISPCPGVETDNLILSFVQAPEVMAGVDMEICEDEPVQLTAQATEYDQLSWSTSGTGNFQNSTSLNAVYIPSDQDVANGEVVLTLTASGNGPCTEDVTDEILVDINSLPTVDAGDDGIVCATGAIDLLGVATDYNFVEWSTLGDGNFSVINELESSYTPGINDIAAGEVELVLRATATSPCSATVKDTISVIVQPIAVVDAGESFIVCTNIPGALNATVENDSEVIWTTSGDGSFADATSAETTYIPGSMDMETGSVTVTITAISISPCGEQVSDDLIITYTPGPVAIAGDDDEVCDDQAIPLNGIAEGLSNASLWSSAGDGAFADATNPSTTYLPGEDDKLNGSVVLTFTVSSEDCGDHSDELTLTFQSAPEIEITTEDNSLCEETSIQLNVSALNYGSLNWTTNGDGEFDASDIENPVYTMGTGDISSGSVRLIAAANAILPCQTPARDTIIINYFEAPTAFAGNDTTVCTDAVFNIEGTATNYESVFWFVEDGTGEIDNPLVLETFYTFTEMDIANGSVSLKLVVYSEGDCEFVEDVIDISVQGAPFAFAGPDTSVCESGSIDLTAILLNHGGQGWGTTGDGVFSSSSASTTTYTPGTGDITEGEVKVFISAYALAPCEEPFFDTVIIDVLPQPVVEAGEQLDVCTSEKVITNPEVENYSSVLWTTPGDGTFTDPTLLITEYIPGEDDIANGVVWLTLNAEPEVPCENSVSDDLIVTFKQAASFDLGENIEADYNSQISFDPIITGGSGVYSYLWTPEDMFVDPTIFYATTVELTQELGSVHTLYLTVTDGVSGCETIDSVIIGLELGPVFADIIAEPPFICEGSSSQLDANPSGGTGVYTYNWTSIPPGFTANTEKVTVSPEENTEYVVSVNDGFSQDFDTIQMTIQPSPAPLTIVGQHEVLSGGNENYNVTQHDNWIYEWGVINGSISSGQYSSEIVVNWGEPGNGELWIIPTNQYGCTGLKSSIDVAIGQSNIGYDEFDELDELKVYPNPFNQNFHIDYRLNKEAIVSVELFNSLGQRLYVYEQGQQSEGSHRINIENQDLNNYTGIIIMRLNVNNNSTISKLIRINN